MGEVDVPLIWFNESIELHQLQLSIGCPIKVMYIFLSCMCSGSFVYIPNTIPSSMVNSWFLLSGERGWRQGNPQSRYFLYYWMEAFSSLLHYKIGNGRFQKHLVCSLKPVTSCLCWWSLFTKWTPLIALINSALKEVHPMKLQHFKRLPDPCKKLQEDLTRRGHIWDTPRDVSIIVYSITFIHGQAEDKGGKCWGHTSEHCKVFLL